MIAVSDDDIVFCELYIDILSREGYQVKSFSDKHALFNLLTSIKPDLIITSIRSDSIDGIEFLSSIRASYRLKEIPVIVASVYAECMSEALRIGASEFLVKPFEIEELKEAVRSALVHPPLAAGESQSPSG